MAKAAETRHLILQKAFELVYVNGYQATSIDDIIATTQVTKGAFFYHFKNKDDMGLALIDEIMAPAMENDFAMVLKNSIDPVKDIYALMKSLLLDHPLLTVKYGCPAGNLVQEMSPVSPAFKTSLARLSDTWQQAIEKSIQNGKKAGALRSSVQGKQVAQFVTSGYWGIRNFGKLYNSTDCYHTYLKELKRYLTGLR